MTQPYSFTSLLPTPHTRKRLPRSGFVQTGFEEMDGDLLEATSDSEHVRFAVIQEKAGRQLAFQMKIVSRRPAEFAG
jgi:hypothetical protein